MHMCMVGPRARAHGVAMGMRMHVATNRAGILLAIMRPGPIQVPQSCIWSDINDLLQNRT